MHNYISTRHAVALFIILFTSVLTPVLNAQQKTESSRIISAGGSITEILFALGLGNKIVAVDTSSFFPEAATKLPKIGYFRSLGAEGLMSLDPDLIIAAKGAGPDTALKQVESLGVSVRTYDQGLYTLDAWETLITELGNDYSKQNESKKLIEKVNNGLQSSLTKRQFTSNEINAVALLSIGQRGPVAAGQNTVPNLLFDLAGINNLANELEGYKPFSAELLAKQKIDLVFIPAHVIEGLGGKKAVCQNQILKFSMTESCNVVVMDSLLLMGFGARIDQAVSLIIKQANAL